MANGTSVSQTFPTKVEAKRWVTFTEQQIEEGKRVATLGASALRFLVSASEASLHDWQWISRSPE
jgi:hypothetical protein